MSILFSGGNSVVFWETKNKKFTFNRLNYGVYKYIILINADSSISWISNHGIWRDRESVLSTPILKN